MAVPGKDQTETDASTIICASCTWFVQHFSRVKLVVVLLRLCIFFTILNAWLGEGEGGAVASICPPAFFISRAV
jgi:hypothetical protein